LKRDLLTPRQSYDYDANGNLTSKTDATGSWSYTWDYENRLKQASLSGGITVTYCYDTLGRRIQRNSSGSTIKFVYDGADVMRDLDATGATIADYINGPEIDNKLRQTVSGTGSYFFADHLATTRGLTDTNGNASSGLTHDSFGNLTSGSTTTRYTYTGREIDTDTGLMYYRSRWYDPVQGRFVGEDPIGVYSGPNLYQYVGSNTINFLDPSGLERLQPYHVRQVMAPRQSCECDTNSNVEDDSFLSLIGSYGKGVVKGFGGAAIGTVKLPFELVQDPGGTTTNILDDIEMRVETMAGIIAHPVVGGDAILDAIGELGPNKAMEILGDAGGQLIFFKGVADVTDMARYGREINLTENCRVAPFGNRTAHPVGRWPHYHRRIVGPDGKTVPGGSMKWHRPWEKGF